MDEKNEKGTLNKIEEDFINQADADFSATVFLSTDGKHTVQITADSFNGRLMGLRWAKDTYREIVEEFGTKQEQNVKAYQPNKQPTLPQQQDQTADTKPCPIHNVPMKARQGKFGQYYSHAKNENGNWNYCNGKGFKE